MKIMADLHHADLYQSLILLFERRLGHEVYRPIGRDWYDRGCWGYPFHAEDTALQFLGDAYPYKGITYSDFLRAVTADELRAPPPGERFGLILSSTPPSFAAYERMRHELGLLHIPHVFQSGNDWSYPAGMKNLLNSTTVPPPPGVHEVRYHQEFSLALYQPLPSPQARPRRISSFMHYTPRPDFIEALEREMPGWEVRIHGAGGRDGQPDGTHALAAAMRGTRYLLHQKLVEGYGFNAHFAAACGVPILMRVAANKHQTIGALLEPGVTCLDLDDYASPGHLADAIRRFDERYEEHSHAIAERFREHVRFDDEAARIRAWLEGLQA